MTEFRHGHGAGTGVGDDRQQAHPVGGPEVWRGAEIQCVDLDTAGAGGLRGRRGRLLHRRGDTMVCRHLVAAHLACGVGQHERVLVARRHRDATGQGDLGDLLHTAGRRHRGVRAERAHALSRVHAHGIDREGLVAAGGGQRQFASRRVDGDRHDLTGFDLALELAEHGGPGVGDRDRAHCGKVGGRRQVEGCLQLAGQRLRRVTAHRGDLCRVAARGQGVDRARDDDDVRQVDDRRGAGLRALGNGELAQAGGRGHGDGGRTGARRHDDGRAVPRRHQAGGGVDAAGQCLGELGSARGRRDVVPEHVAADRHRVRQALLHRQRGQVDEPLHGPGADRARRAGNRLRRRGDDRARRGMGDRQGAPGNRGGVPGGRSPLVDQGRNRVRQRGCAHGVGHAVRRGAHGDRHVREAREVQAAEVDVLGTGLADRERRRRRRQTDRLGGDAADLQQRIRADLGRVAVAVDDHGHFRRRTRGGACRRPAERQVRFLQTARARLLNRGCAGVGHGVGHRCRRRQGHPQVTHGERGVDGHRGQRQLTRRRRSRRRDDAAGIDELLELREHVRPGRAGGQASLAGLDRVGRAVDAETVGHPRPDLPRECDHGHLPRSRPGLNRNILGVGLRATAGGEHADLRHGRVACGHRAGAGDVADLQLAAAATHRRVGQHDHALAGDGPGRRTATAGGIEHLERHRSRAGVVVADRARHAHRAARERHPLSEHPVAGVRTQGQRLRARADREVRRRRGGGLETGAAQDLDLVAVDVGRGLVIGTVDDGAGRLEGLACRAGRQRDLPRSRVDADREVHRRARAALPSFDPRLQRGQERAPGVVRTRDHGVLAVVDLNRVLVAGRHGIGYRARDRELLRPLDDQLARIGHGAHHLARNQRRELAQQTGPGGAGRDGWGGVGHPADLHAVDIARGQLTPLVGQRRDLLAAGIQGGRRCTVLDGRRNTRRLALAGRIDTQGARSGVDHDRDPTGAQPSFDLGLQARQQVGPRRRRGHRLGVGVALHLHAIDIADGQRARIRAHLELHAQRHRRGSGHVGHRGRPVEAQTADLCLQRVGRRGRHDRVGREQRLQRLPLVDRALGVDGDHAAGLESAHRGARLDAVDVDVGSRPQHDVVLVCGVAHVTQVQVGAGDHLDAPVVDDHALDHQAGGLVHDHVATDTGLERQRIDQGVQLR